MIKSRLSFLKKSQTIPTAIATTAQSVTRAVMNLSHFAKRASRLTVVFGR
jgi:hypothetical protein